MARPLKEGMDYFPHDVNASTDKKIEALRALYGNDGYAFYFIMLEQIYQEPNFELGISDAETKEETILILAKKVGVTPEKFNQMLNTSLKWGCFNKELYDDQGILTSNGIKKRANVVTEKRDKMRDRYQQNKEIISDAETKEETPQSKVKKKKSKVKKKKSKVKEKDISADTEPPRPFQKRFIPPTFEEVQAYCIDRNNNVDPRRWINHYQSNGWMVGKNKMKDWKAAVRTWETNNKDSPQNQNKSSAVDQYFKTG